MASVVFNSTALAIHYVLIWALLPSYLECLAHCIQFDSWMECTHTPIVINLQCSAFYGLSGYLWVMGNYQDFHILYLWLIVTAQLIGLTVAYVVYAQKIVGYFSWEETFIYTGFLIISFMLGLIHLLVAKDIIKNRWIRSFVISCVSLSGKIGF